MKHEKKTILRAALPSVTIANMSRERRHAHAHEQMDAAMLGVTAASLFMEQEQEEEQERQQQQQQQQLQQQHDDPVEGPSVTLTRPRLFAQRTCLDAMRDEDIRVRFRLRRGAILHLYGLIEERLQPSDSRGHAVPGMVKLLATLYVLGRGSFQTTSGIVCGLSQPTVSRVFHQTIRAMMHLVRRYIQFPQTEREWDEVKMAFSRRARFPDVLGAIDCTHVALRAPRIGEASFRNRKSYHSLNVQVICDARQRIMSVVSKFPGSCHDAHILRHTSVFQLFEGGRVPHGWLVGELALSALVCAWALPRCHLQQRAMWEWGRVAGVVRSFFEDMGTVKDPGGWAVGGPGGPASGQSYVVLLVGLGIELWQERPRFGWLPLGLPWT